MDIEQFAINKKEAGELWRQYRDACKENPSDKFLKDMKQVYHQLKSGKKIVDISVVFQRSGLTFNGEPRLAIALASEKKVICNYHQSGTVIFINPSHQRQRYSWNLSETAVDVVIKNIFPQIPDANEKLHGSNHLQLETMVPRIPGSIRPKGDLGKYYVLWEVEQWKIVPPRDPYLLRRINDNIFVVLAGWKLSELERSVMKGRVW